MQCLTEMPTRSDRTRSRVRRALHRRLRDERGEGVISAAIAVLIMAFLGVAMWVGFNQIWQNAETTTGDASDVYAAIRLAAPGGLGSAPEEDVANEPTRPLVEVMRLAAHRDAVARE